MLHSTYTRDLYVREGKCPEVDGVRLWPGQVIGWAGSVGKWYPTVQEAKPKEVKPCFSGERRGNEKREGIKKACCE